MHELTRRQQEVFDFVRVFKERQGVPPTVREIARHFGFRSATAAADHLRALREKGFLSNTPRQARSHQVLYSRQSARSGVIEVPICGCIPSDWAGRQPDEGWIAVDSAHFGLRCDEQLFAQRVSGSSMMDWLMRDGDIVLFSRTRVPQNGSMVAALIGRASSLSTLRIEKGDFVLQACGESPITVPAAKCVIQGVMIAVIRRCAQVPSLTVAEVGPLPTILSKGTKEPRMREMFSDGAAVASR